MSEVRDIFVRAHTVIPEKKRTGHEQVPKWPKRVLIFDTECTLDALPSTEPPWLDLPAMMRMTLTSPNVMREGRPDWLSPFNFFLLPLLSDLGGYPAGCDRSNFKFITPFNSNRREWKNLIGVNLRGGRSWRIEMLPNGKQDTVVPESLRILLRLYGTIRPSFCDRTEHATSAGVPRRVR